MLRTGFWCSMRSHAPSLSLHHWRNRLVLKSEPKSHFPPRTAATGFRGARFVQAAPGDVSTILHGSLHPGPRQVEKLPPLFFRISRLRPRQTFICIDLEFVGF
jgi:hypothetical protein